MAENSHKQFIGSFKDLLVSGKYSDFTITCGEDTYSVHKAVVCPRSDFFANALDFAVGKAAEDHKVDLPEDDPDIVKLMIQYFYEAEYDPPLLPSKQAAEASRLTWLAGYTYNFPHTCSSPDYSCDSPKLCPHHKCGTDCDSNCSDKKSCSSGCEALSATNGTAEQFLTYAKMYEIADEYNITGLKQLSEDKFLRACQMFWEEAEFPVAANHAFSTTPDHDKGLRDLVSKTISDHDSLLHKPEIKALMVEFNGLAYDLLMLKVEKYGWGK
ncbi:hypothetical protein BCR34DRAFT_52098 [Clohesyomyces aquaticus]|uniref:BTB domain-containing protein n=1 Tax=Clohesyomyces aquaticus TaxID=1231657 RepID=A0A1Y2A454_9PLEO|nr:hypothetical protein BCR34DRAFT_52098 [Clohesyomyces aquaticus]